MGASKPSRPSRKLPPCNNDKPCHDRACPRSWQRIPPSGNVPLFPAKAAGLPAAFFDAPEHVKGKGDLFEKRSPFPPHTPPILPKTFMQVCHGPSGAQALPLPLVPRWHAPKARQEGPSLAMAKGLRMPGILPALPLPVSPATVPPDVVKRIPFSKDVLSFTKYACFPAFLRRGAR